MSKEDVRRDVAMQLRLLQQSFDAFDEAVAARLRLNRTDLRCLDLLLGGGGASEDGELSAGELAAGLGLSPAATTTVIDRLERAGLARRTRDPENRRRVLVAPTEAAREVEREVYRPVGEAGLAALARFDERELGTILDFLHTARKVQREQARRIGGSGL